MLTLSLLRHAKSSWADGSLDDFHRPLNERGRKTAPMMGAYMAANDITPDLILCSSAVRARQTLDLVLPCLRFEAKIKYRDKLYMAAPGEILARVRASSAKRSHVMIVAHNPGLHMLAMGLCGGGKPEAIKDLAQKFPTAALGVFSFDTNNWLRVDQARGHLDLLMTPRMLA